MELSFELLREAGIRLPGQLGGTMGVVGGLIIGQAAVDAHLVSTIVVIVVALTAIATFSIPNVVYSPVRFRMMNVFSDHSMCLLGIVWILFRIPCDIYPFIFIWKIMECHMHIQWLKKEEDYPQHFKILWFVIH